MLVSDSFPLAVDTGVLIALAAATGDWECLSALERPIILPQIVWDEVRRGPTNAPGATTPMISRMAVWPEIIPIPQWLRESLGDGGEAAVIALASGCGWPEVAIDERMGRAVAQKRGLRLTGSLGLLVRAKKNGYPIKLSEAIERMRRVNVRVGADVEREVLRLANES